MFDIPDVSGNNFTMDTRFNKLDEIPEVFAEMKVSFWFV
jgi:hypothetical protein